MRDITVASTQFRDSDGRHILLRGVNLGGDSKVPSQPDGRTHIPTDFSDHRDVSFVGRPFSLDEADAHLSRLSHWGFNCVRLLTTWEAVEHKGLGIYDIEYLEYFREICLRAGQKGLYVFVDFHQDAWSRMSGGDGAPGWTFEVAGLDFTKFDKADAAHVMQYKYDPAKGGRQDTYPVMSWGHNYGMPANAIMWTLFWSGSEFAPDCVWNGRNAGTVLQDAYFGALKTVAEYLHDLPNVIGFDTLNEPGPSLVGRRMDARPRHPRGAAWTALDALSVASGFSRTLPVYSHGKQIGERVMNTGKLSIWLPGRRDPFRAAGAWSLDDNGEPFASDVDYFYGRDSEPRVLERDYVVPFFHRVAKTVRSIRDSWLIFAEISPHAVGAYQSYPGPMPDRTVNALHWYDFTALVTKTFNLDRVVDVMSGEVREGRQAIESHYLKQLSHIEKFGSSLPGGAPTIIGECGIPFDLHDAEAFTRFANGETSQEIWSSHVAALDMMYNVFDKLLLSSTQWNYTASNRNDAMIGDGWNQEDLSIFSRDQVVDPDDADSGGRAIAGFCRPYVKAAQGKILSQRYDLSSGHFECSIELDPAVRAPTEVYLPKSVYGEKAIIEVSRPFVSVKQEGQTARLCTDQSGRLDLQVSPASKA